MAVNNRPLVADKLLPLGASNLYFHCFAPFLLNVYFYRHCRTPHPSTIPTLRQPLKHAYSKAEIVLFFVVFVFAKPKHGFFEK